MTMRRRRRGFGARLGWRSELQMSISQKSQNASERAPFQSSANSFQVFRVSSSGMTL